MITRVSALTRYPEKGEQGISLHEMKLLKGIGIEGDFHQGGLRQISFLSVDVRRWMDIQPEKGLCFGRFHENILIEEPLPDELESGDFLRTGEAILQVNLNRKPCYDECSLFSNGIHCRLSGAVVFAAVIQDGVVRIGDIISAHRHIDGL